MSPPLAVGRPHTTRGLHSDGLGQSGRARQTILAGTRPRRGHRHLLGRSRRDPPEHRRCPGQNPPLAFVHHRPGRLSRHRGRPAGSPPLPPAHPGAALEVNRTVSQGGLVSLGQYRLLAAEILADCRIGIRIEAATLMFFDPDTRELLRTRPNPLTYDQARKLRGARPVGPPPRPSSPTAPRAPSPTRPQLQSPPPPTPHAEDQPAAGT